MWADQYTLRARYWIDCNLSKWHFEAVWRLRLQGNLALLQSLPQAGPSHPDHLLRCLREAGDHGFGRFRREADFVRPLCLWGGRRYTGPPSGDHQSVHLWRIVADNYGRRRQDTLHMGCVQTGEDTVTQRQWQHKQQPRSVSVDPTIVLFNATVVIEQ